MNNNTSENIKDIKDTVSKEARNFQEGFQKVSNAVSDMASHAAHTIKENSEDAVHQMQEKSSAYVKQVEGVVKEDPFRSALVCVGIGFLLGRYCTK